MGGAVGGGIEGLIGGFVEGPDPAIYLAPFQGTALPGPLEPPPPESGVYGAEGVPLYPDEPLVTQQGGYLTADPELTPFTPSEAAYELPPSLQPPPEIEPPPIPTLEEIEMLATAPEGVYGAAGVPLYPRAAELALGLLDPEVLAAVAFQTALGQLPISPESEPLALSGVPMSVTQLQQLAGVQEFFHVEPIPPTPPSEFVSPADIPPPTLEPLPPYAPMQTVTGAPSYTPRTEPPAPSLDVPSLQPFDPTQIEDQNIEAQLALAAYSIPGGGYVVPTRLTPLAPYDVNAPFNYPQAAVMPQTQTQTQTRPQTSTRTALATLTNTCPPASVQKQPQQRNQQKKRKQQAAPARGKQQKRKQQKRNQQRGPQICQ